MRPIRVAVNLLWCVPGQVGGSEEYLARQLGGLAEVDPDRCQVQPTLFTLAGYRRAHRQLTEAYPTRSPRLDGRRRFARVAAEHVWLARHTRGGFDLVHHGGGTAPAVGARPVLLTIHDLQYLEFPEYFSPLKLRYLHAVMPRSVNRAAVIATPTEFVRSTVIDRFAVDPDRVMVVPHGVPPAAEAGGVDPSELRRRYSLGDGPVLVYPAITHPHKNHVLLLEALRAHWTDPELRLVLLGGRGAADDEVSANIEQWGLADRVLRPGRVSDADRDGLLSIATALVFPSRYEGFGAPVIEAMSLGVPVLCSDHRALREVTGGAAMVLPADPDAWGAALTQLDACRDQLISAGRARVRQFTDAVSASALIRAYEHTVGS